MKFTKHTLKKIEDFIALVDYDLIYGKGNFQSGFAIVENQKKIVINRYFETEARINTLLEIIDRLTIAEDELDEANLAFLNEMYKHIQNRAVAQ